jgi:hypothetical protein
MELHHPFKMPKKVITFNLNVYNCITDTRFSLLIENEQKLDTVPLLNRAKSATMIKIDSCAISEEAINALAQLISMCSCLLESQIDNEFLLSLHLLNHVSQVFLNLNPLIFRSLNAPVLIETNVSNNLIPL